MIIIYNFIEKLKKSPNYFSVFGIFGGLRLYIAMEWLTNWKTNQHKTVTLPNTKAPITLRRVISDYSAFFCCLVAPQYTLDFFPQKTYLESVYHKMLRDGRRPLIIDAGANIGMSALYFAEAYPDALVFAIEPDYDNFQLLVENTRAYDGQIIPFHGGIWPRNAGLIIDNPDAGSQHFRTRDAPPLATEHIASITVNEVLARTGADEVLLAKIDIEGAQEMLFKENTEWVAQTHLIILELDDWKFPWGGTSRPFFSCVSKYSFDYLLRGENIFCFQKILASEEK